MLGVPPRPGSREPGPFPGPEPLPGPCRAAQPLLECHLVGTARQHGQGSAPGVPRSLPPPPPISPGSISPRLAGWGCVCVGEPQVPGHEKR